MPRLYQVLALIVAAIASYDVSGADFSGTWTIDLRTQEQKDHKDECGSAYFELKQIKDRIVGNHHFATAGCGRVNEGGEETVKGIVLGDSAVLVVTSGRNGAVVLGVAKLEGDSLHWETRESIVPGQPEGDSPLILGKGTLHRVPDVSGSQPNTSLERTRER